MSSESLKKNVSKNSVMLRYAIYCFGIALLFAFFLFTKKNISADINKSEFRNFYNYIDEFSLFAYDSLINAKFDGKSDNLILPFRYENIFNLSQIGWGYRYGNKGNLCFVQIQSGRDSCVQKEDAQRLINSTEFRKYTFESETTFPHKSTGDTMRISVNYLGPGSSVIFLRTMDAIFDIGSHVDYLVLDLTPDSDLYDIKEVVGILNQLTAQRGVLFGVFENRSGDRTHHHSNGKPNLTFGNVDVSNDGSTASKAFLCMGKLMIESHCDPNMSVYSFEYFEDKGATLRIPVEQLLDN